ncbi:erythroid differentiation-related factor 1 [Periplaneta americana]|uniref:erythroid differentiation-related factor 1 n=1 Tax=Periplaneta americana TaxID=6978 RepID=UPI0037E90512
MEGDHTSQCERQEAAEDEAWRMCPSPDSPRKPVKSTAVVKYSSVQSLANFALLQCNTDLNLPPSNWLSSSAESYGLQYVPSHSSGFSSFRMAHMFPDCVGEVDVVSDAENIKKLLKIPYSKCPVSMMVHRVENTLLIDEFDVHKHLLRTAETEWQWLKKFFFEHVLKSLSDKEKGVFHKNNSRYALQQKSLVSKFLYHSLAVSEPKSDEAEIQDSRDTTAVPVPVPTPWPPLPEPRPEENLPDPTSNHKFARNVVWTFEDIQMLIGTDMPIFGGSTHPCISLRLRDMSKPISVLTGIDYWLDNLMCNVPELVMCYHLDGIVQKYELIKTEDLPHLENSKFSPKVIRDVAQNILSFLKSNATKAGHTYWLFKGKDDDVVKLYDLTSLCTDVMDDKGQNPFTVPVAMLLYRVARNMKHSADGQRQHGTIRMLLKNCLALLVKEKYPQIVTSAHYMLSDLYVPAGTDPGKPCLDGQLSDEDEGGSNHGETEDCDNKSGVEGPLSSSSVPVKALCLSTPDTSSQESKCSSPPPVCGGVEERCKMALQHVASGLECLQFFGQEEAAQDDVQYQTDKQACEERDAPKMARPFQAIPMPYSPLGSQNENKEEAVKKKKEDGTLLCRPDKEDNLSWNTHLRILLYEKASLVFVVLEEKDFVSENYGQALHYIAHELRVLAVLEATSSYAAMRANVLGRAGDCCFKIVQNWAQVDVHREDYAICSNEDCAVMEEVDKDLAALDVKKGLDVVPSSIESMEQMMQASCACYQEALALEVEEVEKSNLQRRLGNIHNELGVLYMHQAAARYQEETKQTSAAGESQFQELFTRSLHHLEAGVKAFDTVHDKNNLALLYSNTARLMRMCAHFHAPTSGETPTGLAGQERSFYNKALSYYQKALQVLCNRRSSPSVWDTVLWELSSALYTMATRLQDFPALGNKSREEVEREVAELYMKTLKYCDLETPGPRLPVYQFRAANIHHRLGSLYHNSYRSLSPDDARRRNLLMLSRLHYDKASRLLLQLEAPLHFLRVQLERVALAEFQAQSAPSHAGKLKALQGALDLMLQCQPILKQLSAPEHKDEEEGEEEGNLVQLLRERLQFVLRSLAKLCLGRPGTLAQRYKSLYGLALRDGGKDSLLHALAEAAR